MWHITLIISEVSVTSRYIVRVITLAVFCLCITNIIRSYHSQTKRKIIQCQNINIDEQIFAITVLLGRGGLKIHLIWSCLLQDCKMFCLVITRSTDTGWLPVHIPLANNSYRSESFGVLCLFSVTHCSLLRLIVRSGLDFPTFASSRLYACHQARAPGGGRWNCGREMSGNFA